MKKQKNSNVHTFKTGAIRDSQEGKECYIETINSHDKEVQDTREPKAAVWQMICEVYNCSDGAVDALSPLGRLTLVGYSVPPDICKHYAEENVLRLKEKCNNAKKEEQAEIC